MSLAHTTSAGRPRTKSTVDVDFGPDAGASEISPSSLAVIKRQIYDDLQRDQRSALEWSVAEMKRMVKEPDFEEGTAALGERRPPTFGPLS